jgi:hypothetical protein
MSLAIPRLSRTDSESNPYIFLYAFLVLTQCYY